MCSVFQRDGRNPQFEPQVPAPQTHTLISCSNSPRPPYIHIIALTGLKNIDCARRHIDALFKEKKFKTLGNKTWRTCTACLSENYSWLEKIIHKRNSLSKAVGIGWSNNHTSVKVIQSLFRRIIKKLQKTKTSSEHRSWKHSYFKKCYQGYDEVSESWSYPTETSTWW